MGTQIYGASDDLVEIQGDITGEKNAYNTGGDTPMAVFLSDGTVLAIHYNDDGVWKIEVKEKGTLFDRIDICTDPEAERPSDTVHMHHGLKWCYALESDEGLERVS